MFRSRKSRRSGQTQAKRFACRPSIEAFEKRELLATVAPFIQGTAFIDPASTGVLTNTNVPLAGATVSLYSGSTFLASTTTGGDGGYLFNTGLSIGSTYTLVESAPGYSNTGAQALSSIDPASVISPSTIQVTVVDPNAVKADFTSAVQYGSPATYDHVYYTLNGTSGATVPTQLTFTLSGASNVSTTPFNTFCVDLNDPLNFNTVFPSVIDPQSALPNGGEIGYLYNQYGTVPPTSSLPASIQSFPTKDVVAGLQVAIWELEYGSGFALNGYVMDNLGTTATDYADLQAAAAAFVADATGKSEKVAVIDASLTGSLPSPAVTSGAQSVLAPESFNFGNKLKNTPTINTSQQPASAVVGSSIADKATVSGGNNPKGTVTFSLYSNINGTGTPLFTDTQALSGGAATSKGYTATASGTDYWVATYNGDANNNAVTSPAASEPVGITKASPAINTQQQPASATVGTSIADKATVSGGYSPTGTVTFSLYSNINGTGTPLFIDTEALSGGTATSKGYTATATGTDYWVATYNGDSNNSPATSPAASEPVIIQPATTITGTKYLDATGNGLSCNNGPLPGDTPEAGVTIDLFSTNPMALIATTVTAANGTYSFAGVPYGSYYVAEAVPSGVIQTGPIQNASCPTNSVANCGFSTPTVGSGCYVYDPSGASWAFSGQSGITGNGSGFTWANPNAPQGSDVAFLQQLGSFSQVVSNWAAGNYTLNFSAAQRASYGLNNQDFQILVDGNVVGTCNPTGGSYQTYSTPSFSVGSGSHTITFQGLDSRGGDNTCFIDNICAVQNSGTVTVWNNAGSNQAYYTVNVSASMPSSTNNNFSDYVECNPSAIANVSYKVNGCGPYSSLSGVTSQSSTVSATFTVTGSTNEMVTLVSYVVPSYGAPLSSQVEYSVDTGTFTPGTHTVSVTLPCGYYQVDFVCGAAITQFGPNSSSNVSYHGQDRYISSDNSGWNVPSYCPPPLANVQTDVGSVAAPGTLAYTNGNYTVTADGNDIWNNADAFNYVCQTLGGDGEIIAKVDSVSSSDAWAKAGLMIRQSLNSNSAQASIFATPGNGVDFQDRETAGAGSNQIGYAGYCSSNSVYLKLVRMGNTITGYDSSNGVTWTQVGTDTVNMTGTVYVGLAVSSHAVNATAKFDNVNTGGYYCGGAGQSLIQNCGGGSWSTGLSSWLAQNYPNLYGSNAGSCNLWGKDNDDVANFCQSLEDQYGSESLECQTLKTALDEYFSNWSWGGSCGSSAGFNVSWGGICSTTVSTANDGSAFYGGTSMSLWTMLGDINNQASGGCLYPSNTSYHQQAYGCVTWVSAWI